MIYEFDQPNFISGIKLSKNSTIFMSRSNREEHLNVFLYYLLNFINNFS